MKDQDFERKLLEMELPHHGLISKEEEETAWKNIVLEIEESNKSAKWWLIAASIAVIFGIGWWLLPKEDTYRTHESEQLDIRLVDKSRVTLNWNSQLTISKNYNQKNRTVNLQGEAFFNVERNPNKPFVVNIHDRKIKVLGTSFSVKHKDKKTIISVRTGKVEIASETDIQTLVAGQKGKISADHTITIADWDANEFAWYSGKLSFENKSMKEVAKTLSTLSNKPVVVSEKIANCKLSLHIDYERISEVFDIIAETLEITWNDEPEKIYFDGKDC